jgi:hypothetical protein
MFDPMSRSDPLPPPLPAQSRTPTPPAGGVWSVTKSALLNVALLRLAQCYGREILDHPIARYVAARRPGHPLQLSRPGRLPSRCRRGGAAADATATTRACSRWCATRCSARSASTTCRPPPPSSPAPPRRTTQAGRRSHWYLTNRQLQRIESAAGCTTYVPQMKGWGGNTVTVLPGGVTLIRMRNCRDAEEARNPPTRDQRPRRPAGPLVRRRSDLTAVSERRATASSR